MQPDAQQRQPILTILNFFTLPDNHQKNPKPLFLQVWLRKQQLWKLKTNASENHRNTILIIGDRHARGWAAQLSSSPGTTFEVTGAVMPGPGLETIARLARRYISHLHLNDFVIICGVANDINRNEANTGLKTHQEICTPK